MKKLLLTLALVCTGLLLKANEPYNKDLTIDYLVVYDDTPKPIVEEAGGEEAYAQQVVDSINVVLKNSNLEYRFRLAGVHHINQRATDIVGGLDLVMFDEGVKNKRKECKADLVVLLTEVWGDPNSGLSNQHAKRWEAFSSVSANMAATAYTAAHEAGHVLGCYHSRSEYDHSPSDHPWAAAYISEEGYNTVMNTMAPGQVVPIFSGPESRWNGVVMGDETHDNVRMLRQTLPEAVHFGEYLEESCFYLEDEEMEFDNKAHKDDFWVRTDLFFTVKASASWIHSITPEWGLMDTKIEFSIEENTTGADRTAILEIMADDSSKNKTITITQYAGDIPSGIVLETAEEDEKVVYDLNGRRVKETIAGQVYIRNGKKFVAQ